MQARPTRDRYRALLGRLAVAYRRIEPALLAAPSFMPAGLPAYRPRLAALERDLAALPGRDVRAGGAPIRLASREACLGARYVIDGSALGARAMAERLAAQAPELLGQASSYWDVQGQALADWPETCRLLRTFDADSAEAERAVAAARDAFGIFIDAFDAAEHST